MDVKEYVKDNKMISDDLIRKIIELIKNDHIIDFYFIDKYEEIDEETKSVDLKLIPFQNIKPRLNKIKHIITNQTQETYTQQFYFNLIRTTNNKNNKNNKVTSEEITEVYKNDKFIILSKKIKVHDDKCFPNLHISKYNGSQSVTYTIYDIKINNNIKIIQRNIQEDKITNGFTFIQLDNINETQEEKFKDDIITVINLII